MGLAATVSKDPIEIIMVADDEKEEDERNQVDVKDLSVEDCDGNNDAAVHNENSSIHAHDATIVKTEL